MEPIGMIRSWYRQRFAIPRQPGLVPSARATIHLDERFSLQSVRGVEEFSHLWIIFKFHHSRGQDWKEVVRPPKLGGKVGRGVFATRSPFRPNDIGLSVVKLLRCTEDKGRVVLEVQGGDFLDGTPVYDIKPYVPYADHVVEAESVWAQSEAARVPVLCDEADLKAQLSEDALAAFEDQILFIRENLALDPRPAHERGKDAKPGQSWGVLLGDFEVKFTARDGTIVITRVELPEAL